MADTNRIVMLTTTDNPYNPFTNFDEWYNFDETSGYNTCGYLARIARTSNGLSESDNDAEIERAIDEIVKLDLTGRYKKLVFNEKGDQIPPVGA